ncbi:MAG: tetratricopeptide repeat protein, partial [Candidatus Zixiibacteriota bacterium]
ISVGVVALLIHSIFFLPEKRNKVPAILISIGGGLLFGFSNAPWAAAGGFEVYSLGIVLISLTLLSLEKYDKYQECKYIFVAVYLFGLSLANHLSAVSLIPALIMLIVKSKPDSKRVSPPVFFFILALTLYLYLPVRSAHNPLFDWNHPASLNSFIDHVTARRYQTYITGFGFENWFQNIWRSVRIMLNQYPLYISAFGFIGLFVPGKIRFNLKFALISILVLNLLLSALYDIPDIDQYYLPSILILALGLVSFLDFILNRLAIRMKYIVTATVVIILTMGTFFRNYSSNDQSGNNLARVYGENILKSAPEDSFLISVGDNSNSTLYYLRYVEKMRTDLEIYDSVISIERLKRRMKDFNLRTDLSGPDLCVLLGRAFPERTYFVKEHMLARGNPFDYKKIGLFPRGLVYGFEDDKIDPGLWEDLIIPSYSGLSQNLDFKGMTMLVNLHLCYGEDLYEARKRREAVEQYREARKIAESSREASVHNSLGIFFRHEGWPVLARQEYESALNADHLTADEKSNIYVNLGNLEKDSGKSEEAIEYYLKALEINSDNVEASYNLFLARAYDELKRGNYKAAAENFKEALNLPDSDPNISLNLGVIYDRNLNDTSKAVYYYKKFIELSPVSERTDAVRDRIRELEAEPLD